MLLLALLPIAAALQSVQRAQLRAGVVDIAGVAPGDLSSTCVSIASGGLAAPGHAKALCDKEIKDEATCKFLSEQIMLASADKPSPAEFCGKVVAYASANSKTDVMAYVAPATRWDVCLSAVAASINKDGELVKANFQPSCKTAVEAALKGLRYPNYVNLATEACKQFKLDAEKASGTGLLSADSYVGFCECAKEPCRADHPLMKAMVCPQPDGFPKEAKDLDPSKFKAGAMPVLSLEDFIALAKKAYGTARLAFQAADENSDKKVDKDEFGKLCEALGVEAGDAVHLFPQIDANDDGYIDLLEFSTVFGVTLDGLRARVLGVHGNADKAFTAADANGDGKVSKEEFMAQCAAVHVGPADAARLFKKVDSDGNGELSEEEYKNAFGVSLKELKKRAREKYGPPSKSFPAFDKDGDGSITAEEWTAGCAELDIPAGRAEELFKELDQNGDGAISEEEYRAAMGMGLEDLKREVYGNLGNAEEAMKAMDKDGDGIISEEEFVKGMKEAGYGEKEAKEMYKQLAGDDGKLTAEDWAKATGADDLQDMRDEAGVGEKELHEGVGALPVAAEADANGDGTITEEEYLAACEANGVPAAQCEDAWRKVDEDGDGLASAEDLERVAKAARDAAEQFAKADKDGSGALSEAEFLEAAKGQGMSEEEAKKRFKELDADGDGKVSAAEFIHGGGFGAAGAATPPPIEVDPLALEEVARRCRDAFGTIGEAWEAIAGKGANHMTPEQWLKHAPTLGMTEEEAALAYEAMDTDGDGKVDFQEFQESLGVTLEDFKRRLLRKYGNSEKALNATDTDGDGHVSQAEFEALADALGVPRGEAQKIFEKLEKAGEKLTGEEFKEHFGMTADDMKERLAGKYDDAHDAFADFDANGDGEVSLEEFLAKAEELGLSKEEAEAIFKKADKDGSGGLNKDEFLSALGVGADELREACFEYMRDPKFAFHRMDKDGDMLLSPDEWREGLGVMGFTAAQADRLFDLADTNFGESTQGFISRYEFWKFLAYRPGRPHFLHTWNTYYGDLDHWGYGHQHHNKLQHAFLAKKKL